MEGLIVSVVSLVILAPIIYFLPLGLSNKGKGVLILVAFLIANLGLVAKNNFTLWQTALIILLLTILTVYILEKRLNKFLYSHVSNKESTPVSLKEGQDGEQVEKEITIAPEKPKKENLVVDEVEEIDPIEISLSKEVKLDEIEEIQIHDNVSEEPSIVVADIDELPENSLKQNKVEWDEEIDFLENSEASLEEVQTPFEKDETPAETSDYMSEIEMLIESSDSGEELEQDDDVLSSLDMEQDDIVQKSFIERIEDMELEELDFKEDDLEGTEESISEVTTKDDSKIEADIEEIDFSQFIEEDAEEHTESENVWMLDDLELEDIATTEADLVPEEVLKEIEAVEQEVAASFEEETYNSEEAVKVQAEEEGSDDNLLFYDEEFEIPANISFESEPEIEAIELEEIELESELPITAEEPKFEEDEQESELPISEEETQLEEEELGIVHPTSTEEPQLDDEEPESELPIITEELKFEEEELESELPIIAEEPKFEEEELESELPITAEEPKFEEDELESELPITAEEPKFEEEELESELPIITEEPKFEEEELESELPITAEEPKFEEEELESELPIIAEEPKFEEDELMPVVKEEQKSALQQQLFHTMVSQLHIARKHMSSEAYEDLIKEHLHPGLPEQDYYTFESLLVQHYISHKELGKLEQLLTDMSGKYTKYPILDMEIHYLYKQYCEKTR